MDHLLMIAALWLGSPWAPGLPEDNQWAPGTTSSQWDLTVPSPEAPKFPRYISGQKGPVIVFVACQSRAVAGAFVCHEPDGFFECTGPTIVVSPDGVERLDLKTTATDLEIRLAAGLEVRQAPRPFLDPRSIPRKVTVPPDDRDDEARSGS